jgi:DNA-binding winged helix-turn-helix (wHTH) protein
VSLQFGDCTLDLDARELRRQGESVHVSPKAFELLKLLVENRPRALSKTELLETIWPGVFVSDASLARVVTELREAIGDRARRPHLVRTVHAFGYAFSGEAVEQDRPAALSAFWFVSGARRFDLKVGEQVIGRDSDAGLQLDSPRVSRRHAILLVTDGAVSIEDRESKNGTFLNGERLCARAALRPGDTVRIGPFSLVLHTAGPSRSTETETLSRA